MKRINCVLLILMVLVSTHTVSLSAKPLKGRCTVQQGKAANINDLILEAEKINTESERYAEVALNPSLAKNDNEALGAMQAREVFILIDQSGSMGGRDSDPRNDSPVKSKSKWTLWDSARVATEGLAEVALSLDRDGEVPIYFFHDRKNVHSVTAKTVPDVTKAFNKRSPEGGTPLAEALNELYVDHLKGLLEREEPFTVVTLTDGVPNDQNGVVSFFKSMVKNHKLTSPGKEHLAAFSFIQMGDDASADRFLSDLDDNLKPMIGIDIIDTKKDNFIFGTDPRFKQDCGPLAVFRDAIFD